MKKRIVVFVSLFVVCCFGCKDVYAKTFQESINKNNYYYVSSIDNAIYKYFITFFDGENHPYYSFTPHISFMPKQNYTEKEVELSKDVVEDLSKIISFGYGYQGNTSLSMYYATQYLIFERIMEEGYTIDVLDFSKQYPDDCIAKEIAEIREMIRQKTPAWENKVIQEKKLLIKDSYLVENFLFQGENLLVKETKEGVEVQFLEGTDFQLRFVPKTSCEKVKIWEDFDWGTQLISMDNICEQEHVVSYHYEEPAKEENKEPQPIAPSEEMKDISSENKEEEEEIVRELVVPNTSKYSFFPILFLVLLGNGYYVFKK